MCDLDQLKARIKELESQLDRLCLPSGATDPYYAAMHMLQVGLVVYSDDHSVHYMNPAAHELLGSSGALLPQFSTHSFLDIEQYPLSPDSHPVVQAFSERNPVSDVVVGVQSPEDELVRWMLVNAKPLCRDGKQPEVVASYVDITDLKNVSHALKNSQISLGKVLEHTPLGVCVTNEDGHFESVNQSYCDLYGYNEGELLGRHFTLVAQDEQKEYLIELHDEFMESGFELRGEWDVLTKEGEVKSILADAALIHDEKGQPKKVTFVMDITKEKLFQKELESKNKLLEESSLTDALTGISNRRYLMKEMDSLVRMHSRYPLPLSVIMIDIDHFKGVNDTYGHQVGDEVLKGIAQLIENSARDVDVVGRYGGEEFMVATPNTDLDGAIRVAERIRTAVAVKAFSRFGIQLTVSCGVAQFSSETVDDFIRLADARMYKAKRSGRNAVVSTGCEGTFCEV